MVWESASDGSCPHTPTPNPNLESRRNYQSATAGSPSPRRSVENDECFHCKQKGHWIRDCPLKSCEKKRSPPLLVSSSDGKDFPQRQCRCGEGPCLILTSKTVTNPWRKFYRCPGDGPRRCNFFQWCDSARPDDGLDVLISPYPICSCGAGKCYLITATSGEHAGRMCFICPVKKGQGACNFFQLHDCPGKDCNIMDVRSDENIQLTYSRSISDDEKDIEAAMDCEQAEDGCKPEEVLFNVSHGKGLPSSACGERFLVEEMGQHCPAVKKLCFDDEGGEYNGDEPEISNETTETVSPSTPGEGFQVEEVSHCIPIEEHDLIKITGEGEGNGLDRLLFFGYINEEAGEDGNGVGLEGLLFYGSIKEEFLSSSGKEFQLEVDRSPQLQRLEGGYDNGQEDEILYWSIKKRPRVEVGNHSAIRGLDFHEGCGGDDNGLVCVPFRISEKKGLASSSSERFQVDEVNHHPDTEMLDVHKGEEDGMGAESVSLDGWKGEEPVSSSDEGYQLKEVRHHPEVEMLDLREGCGQEDNKGLSVPFSLSTEKGLIPSSGESFQLDEVGHHPEIEMVDLDFEWGEDDEKALEDALLDVSMKKGLVSSFGEGFQREACHHPSIGLDFHEEAEGDGGYIEGFQKPPIKCLDLHGGDGNGPEIIENRPMPSSIDGFQVEGVGHHAPIKRFNVHEEGVAGDSNGLEDGRTSGEGFQVGVVDYPPLILGPTLHKEGGVVDGNGLEGVSSDTSKEKGSPPLPSEGHQQGKMDHHQQLLEETADGMVEKSRKCFQYRRGGGRGGLWTNEHARSPSICFKCGKLGHLKKGCSN